MGDPGGGRRRADTCRSKDQLSERKRSLTSMSGRWLFVLCSTVALGQVQPFDIARQALSEAQKKGDFAQAAAKREALRAMLAQMSLDSPQLAGRVQNVAQLYRVSGRQAEARAVVQDAL